MKGEIIVKEFIDEEKEESSLWFYKEGFHWLCLNEALDEDICEVEFLDEEQGLLTVMYSNWASRELLAIMDTSGDVRMAGIDSIEEYYKEHGLLIVIINSTYADEDLEHDYYNESDETFWMVLDIYGTVVIESTQSPIKFYDEDENDEKVFVIGWGESARTILLKDVLKGR